MFQHTMEPMLRTKLSMPVKLTKGVVTLIEPFTLCQEGDELTPEQAQILARSSIEAWALTPSKQSSHRNP